MTLLHLPDETCSRCNKDFPAKTILRHKRKCSVAYSLLDPLSSFTPQCGANVLEGFASPVIGDQASCTMRHAFESSNEMLEKGTIVEPGASEKLDKGASVVTGVIKMLEEGASDVTGASEKLVKEVGIITGASEKLEKQANIVTAASKKLEREASVKTETRKNLKETVRLILQSRRKKFDLE